MIAKPVKEIAEQKKETFEQKLADQLEQRRLQAGWSLDQLAEFSGISRSTLSRIERGDTSPTASQLGLLASCYDLTISQLIALAEEPSADILRANTQTVWTDPDTGFVRRSISPPRHGFHSEMIEGFIPQGQEIVYAEPQVRGMEQYLYLLEGELLYSEGHDPVHEFHLFPGDCVRLKLFSQTRYVSMGDPGARYVLVVTLPKRTL